jgi:hypothetical protein
VPEVKLRTAINIAGVALSVLCLVFFARTVASHIGSMDLAPVAMAKGIALGLLPYMAAYAMFAGAWLCLLRLFGERPHSHAAFGVFLTAQFGKYLPGNVGHHVGRPALASQHGMRTDAVVASMALEMLIVIALVVLLSIPQLRAFQQQIDFMPLWPVIAVLGAVLIAAIFVLSWRNLRKREPETAIGKADPLWVIYAVLLSAGGLVLTGGSLLAVDGFHAVDFATAARVISLFCVAWLSGFVTPGAPAGLGVRELVIVQGLSPVFGAPTATTMALTFRLLTTLADLIAFGIGLVLLRTKRGQP